ncbi:unnamed protein product [Amoebophrya sp. A25]|nr:unnamed protein product [Amoebophrya sp. A25]|eukprot:GSA25T00023626001.1
MGPMTDAAAEPLERRPDALMRKSIRPRSAGPTYRRFPCTAQPSPSWYQYPRPDYYAEYDRGEKVGHLCRPESGTAVMYHTLRLPPQPEAVLTIDVNEARRARPRTAIAAPRVEKPELMVRVRDEETKKKKWERPKTAPSTRTRAPEDIRSVQSSAADAGVSSPPVAQERTVEINATTAGGGGGALGGSGRNTTEEAHSAGVVKHPQSGAAAVSSSQHYGRRKAEKGNKASYTTATRKSVRPAVATIDARFEKITGFGGYVPGEQENIGAKRFTRSVNSSPYLPAARDPPLQSLSSGAPASSWQANIQPPAEVKARYLRKFAEICNRMPPNSYAERSKQRYIRGKTIWRGPHEYSYKAPKDPPAVCNPRKGLHPEAGISWHPVPTPAEVPERNLGRVYGADSLDFRAYDQKRRSDHYRFLISQSRAQLIGKPKIMPHVPTLDC